MLAFISLIKSFVRSTDWFTAVQTFQGVGQPVAVPSAPPMELVPCMDLQQLVQVYKNQSIITKQKRAERKIQLDQMVVSKHKANVAQETRQGSKHAESKVDHSPTLEH
jgi:hypothetical protein